MITAKSCYIKERKMGEESKSEKEILIYWEQILSGVNLEVFPKVYGKSFKSILFPTHIEPVISKEMKQVKALMDDYRISEQEFLKEETIPAKNMFFSDFFTRFLKFGVYTLKKEMPDLQAGVIKSYSRALLDKLGAVSLRVLIFEMYLCKESGSLSGTPSDQYIQYNDEYLKDENYIIKLFQLYPGLERLVFESIFIINRCYREFLTRLGQDKKRLCNEFHILEEDLLIDTLKSDTSDSHNGGETVFILTLVNKRKIVYKSRSLKAEEYLHRTIDFIEPGLLYDLGHIKLLNLGDHGWEEFVEADCCKDRDQLKRYYYRFGVLIFVSYILNANDFHEENLIANGEYPRIIDAETILENWKSSDQPSARDKINESLRASVMCSGLLPKRCFDKNGQGIDMSAVGGQGGAVFPFKIPHIVDEYTSNMHLEYKHPEKETHENLAKLNDEYVPVTEFTSDIVYGFVDAYQYTYTKKDDMYRLINDFSDLTVRHLIQDTQKYSMILHLSYHPDFLQDCRDRELFLCSLYKNSTLLQKSNEIVKYEVDDMLHMDIPYFTVQANETILRNGSGAYIEDYFSVSSIERACDKVSGLSGAYLCQQVMYIKIALDDVTKTNERNLGIEPKRPIEFGSSYMYHSEKSVKRIADYLIEKAVWGENRTDVSWIDVLPLGDDDNFSWDIRPISVYLYEGLAGIAIFFAAMNKVFPCNKYEEILQAIAVSLFHYTDQMLEDKQSFEDEDSGFFNGEAGLVYTYSLLYQITKKEQYLKYAVRHAEILTGAIKKDRKYDLVYGNAGAVLALIGLYELTQKEEYLIWAQQAGDMLIISQDEAGGWASNPQMCPLAGMSHGAAGIIYALARLYHYTQSESTLDSIINGLKFERSLYDETHMNWKDERHFKGEKVSDQNIFTVAWCHGAPGILLSRLGMVPISDEKTQRIITQDIENAIKTVFENGISHNNCLCHGNLGNTEIVNEYCKMFDHKNYGIVNREIRKEIVASIAEDKNMGLSSLYGYCSLGFMNGMSGIGYSILRDFSTDLPCVLSIHLR